MDKHNSKENNDIPRDKSRCNGPPDWLKTTMARIVPSLQLAQTEPLLHLALTLSKADRECFCTSNSSHGTILCRLASQASSLGWLVGNNILCIPTRAKWRKSGSVGLLRCGSAKKRLYKFLCRLLHFTLLLLINLGRTLICTHFYSQVVRVKHLWNLRTQCNGRLLCYLKCKFWSNSRA